MIVSGKNRQVCAGCHCRKLDLTTGKLMPEIPTCTKLCGNKVGPGTVDRAAFDRSSKMHHYHQKS